MKIKRIVAYIIDIFIVSIISSLLIEIPIFNFDSQAYTEKYNEYFNEIISSGSSDIDLDNSINHQCDLQKIAIPLNIITVSITFIYFGIFAFCLHGQTLGKKIMKIRIISNNSKELNPGLFILRQILITNLIPKIINIIVTITTSGKTWYSITNNISNVSFFLIVIIAGLIIFREDERGVHDLVGQTKVISTKGE